jgi:hypothetical protein
MALGHARAPESGVPSENDYNSRGGKVAAVKPIFPNDLDSQ